MNSIVVGRVMRPREVGHEHRGALEHADQQRLAARVVGVDLGGDLADAGGDAGPRRPGPLDVGVELGHLRHDRQARAVRGLRMTCSLPDTLRAPNPPGRSTTPWPCQSVSSRSTAATWTASSGPAPRPARRPLTTRRRSAGGRAASAGRPSVTARAASASSSVGVVGDLRRRAGEGLGHPAAQHVLGERQQLVPDPDPPEARVVVVRVVPDQAGPARRRRPGSSPAAAPGTGATGVRPTHAAQRARAGPAAEGEQHGLGLVVEGVAEQDRARRRRRARRSAPSRAAASGPPAALTCTRTACTAANPSGPGLRPATASACAVRTRLQAVVDGDARARGPAPRRPPPRRARGSRRPRRQATTTSPPTCAARSRDRSASTATAGSGPALPPASRRPIALGVRRGRQASTRPTQRVRVGDLGLGRQRLGRVQMVLNVVDADRSTTVRTKATPSTYWRVLASRPSSLRSSRSSGLPPLRAAGREPALDRRLGGDHPRRRPRSSPTRRGPRPAT